MAAVINACDDASALGKLAANREECNCQVLRYCSNEVKTSGSANSNLLTK